jgi:hypothetical protein
MDNKLLNQIVKDANSVLKKKEIVARLNSKGGDIGGIPREAFGAFLAVGTMYWAKTVRASNIKPD